MAGRHSRTKGAGGERELCALLSDAFGEKICRKLGQARDAGNDIDLAPFRIECKRRARVGNLYEWLAQTIDRMRDDETPVVMVRADGQKWLAVMFLPDWIKLAREEIANGRAG